MKRIMLFTTGLLSLAAVVSTAARNEQWLHGVPQDYNLTIDSYSIDAGRIISGTGGSLTLRGGLEKISAIASSSGGSLTLTGGSWVATEVPMTQCANLCGDIDGSKGPNDLRDYASMASCFGRFPDQSYSCLCTDLNADGVINLVDFETFSLLFGATSSNTPPTCP